VILLEIGNKGGILCLSGRKENLILNTLWDICGCGYKNLRLRKQMTRDTDLRMIKDDNH
jgi:hypothetical protein